MSYAIYKNFFAFIICTKVYTKYKMHILNTHKKKIIIKILIIKVVIKKLR